MTQWLTKDQADAWLAYRKMSALLTAELDRQLLRDAGMPHTYYGVLAILMMQPERRLLLSELAKMMDFSQSRLSHAIARMEEAGWVVREPCPTSRRSTYAVLTEAGVAVQTAAAPGHVRAVQENMFDVLTEQQVHQLRDICGAVLNNLTARAAAGPTPPRDGC